MSNRILIVDDSKAMRMIVRRTLRQAGFNHDCEEATNGVEALKMIEADQPKLVISDWNMPDMSGYELLKALKEKQIDVPFGMITTEGTPEMRSKASEAGARFLVQKPFTAEDLARAIGSVLT